MKKLIIICFMFLFLFLASCSNTSKDKNNTLTSKTSKTTTNTNVVEEDIKEMFIYIGDNKLKVELENNSSVKALVNILKENDITYEAHDFGGFEKVGDLGFQLPTNDSYIDVTTGDVILYTGSNLCLYYGNNSYSFTRIGKINGYTKDELKEIYKASLGNIEVRLSLE